MKETSISLLLHYVIYQFLKYNTFCETDKELVNLFGHVLINFTRFQNLIMPLLLDIFSIYQTYQIACYLNYTIWSNEFF